MAASGMDDRIIGKLDSEHIEVLYHFTDILNLPRIFSSGGLRPTQELRLMPDFGQVILGGDRQSQLDDQKWKNDQYVRLNFWPRTPMAYYREADRNLCYILVNSRVGARNGVLFTDTNAIAGDHVRKTGPEGLELVDFRAGLHPMPWTEPDAKRKYQAEVLVPGIVDCSLFKAVCFRSPAHRNEGLRLCPNRQGIPFDADDSLFNRSVGFLVLYGVTSQALDKSNVMRFDF